MRRCLSGADRIAWRWCNTRPVPRRGRTILGKELPYEPKEAKKVVEQTRSFIGRIYANEVVLDGPFKPLELEAILFLMRNRPAPPDDAIAFPRAASKFNEDTSIFDDKIVDVLARRGCQNSLL